MTTDYEWCVEEMDGEDIVDNHFCDDYAECVEHSEAGDAIALVCSIGNESEGLQDRDWAYVVDGKLPGEFPAMGRKVPKRFHAEVAKLKRELAR